MLRLFLQLLGSQSREEDKQVLLLLGKGFFMGIFVASYEVASETLFINALGEALLEEAFIISGFLAMLAAFIFARLQRSVPYSHLVTGSLILITILAVSLAFLYSQNQSDWVIFLIFAMQNAFVGLIVLGFWGVFGRVFNLRQSKRIIGGIDTGQLTATMLAFFSIPFLMPYIGGINNLLYIGGFSVVFCLLFHLIIVNKYSVNAQVARTKAEIKETRLGRIFKNKYLRLLSFFLILSMIASKFMDYTFVAVTEKQYTDEESLSRFLAFFKGSVMIVGFLIQTFINDKIIGDYGLRVALSLMPVILGVMSLSAFMAGGFFGYETDSDTFIFFFIFIAVGKLFTDSLKDSLEEPAFKLFFLPLDIKIRFDIQTKIEGIVNEFAGVLAGAFLLIAEALYFFELIHYSVLIIAVIIGMLLVAGKLYQQYRLTLQSSLISQKNKVKQELLVSRNSLELIQEKVKGDKLESILPALELLEKMDPLAFHAKVMEMSLSDNDEIRGFAMQQIEKLVLPEARIQLKGKQAESNTPAMKLLVENALQALEDNDRADYTRDQLLAMLRSRQVKERRQAIRFIALNQHPQFVPFLIELLKDPQPEVRIDAIVAAGKLKSPELWTPLIDCLSLPFYGNSASSSIVAIGEGILPNLEAAFYKSGQNATAMYRIVQIYGRIGGYKAIELLWKKIDFPDRKIVSEVLRSLSNTKAEARDYFALRIRQTIEADIGDIFWNISAISELPDNEEALILKKALLEENKDKLNHMYMLLGMLYDKASIRLVQENVESGTNEGVTYAIELLDIFLSDDLKQPVFTVIDDITDQEKIRKLSEFFPRENFKIKDCLIQIINRDYNHINRWTKACALNYIGTMPGFEVTDDIIANLFNPHPLLREMAAWAIYQIDPTIYNANIYRLPENVRIELDRSIVNSERRRQEGKKLYFEKVVFLSKVSFFKNVPGKVLADLVLVAEEQKLREGQLLKLADKVLDYPILFVHKGSLEICSNQADSTEFKKINLKQGDFFGIWERERLSVQDFEVLAQKDSLLLLFDRFIFQELLADYPVVVRELLSI